MLVQKQKLLQKVLLKEKDNISEYMFQLCEKKLCIKEICKILCNGGNIII